MKDFNIENMMRNIMGNLNISDSMDAKAMLVNSMKRMTLGQLEETKVVLEDLIDNLKKDLDSPAFENTKHADKPLDPFEILGVDISCTKEELKKAYRKRSRETHPDTSQVPTDEFLKVQAAYEAIMKFHGWS